MKKILITGANSYIGTSFEAYMKKFGNEYQIDTLDMLDPNWKETSFSGYDTIFHVAGIAHQKETKKNKDLYYKVNRDLAVEVAQKANFEGVGQLVFLSSMSIYGLTVGKITSQTQPNPNTHYGCSKLNAENDILKIDNEHFKVSIVRPPMIYGNGCRGNYQALSKLAKKMPIFPFVKNSRSMLYIDNLCEFVRLLIENNDQGIFFPQNAEYTNTSQMVKMIAAANGKKIYLVKGFAWLLKLLSLFIGLVNKAFGNLSYDMHMSEYDKGSYQLVSLEESILRTEGSNSQNI